MRASPNGDMPPTHGALVEAARNGEDMPGLPFSALSADEARLSAQLLENWFLMDRQRSSDRKLLADFFRGLGFTLAGIDVEPRGSAAARIRVEPLRTRELCPIHTFGSDADGRYDVVFNWDAPARERIVQALSTARRNTHTIVLHFGRLPLWERDWLRQWSIEHPTQFLVVDESLVLYLASLPGAALRPLFRVLIAVYVC